MQMMKCSVLRALPILFWWTLAVSALSVETTQVAENHTPKVFRPVAPGMLDGRIAYVTARILEQVQMQKHPFDDSISEQFFDKYVAALDPQHLHFTQQDMAEFDKFRARLDDLTISSKSISDTTPAAQIFNRYMQRLTQRSTYCQDLLKSEQFSFTGDERILINRKDAPRPKDVREARKLWRERLRYEYLQEKLARLDEKPAKSNTNKTDKAAGPPKSQHEEIVETLSNRYNRTLKMFVDWDMQDVLQIYLRTLAQVYDPHSDYMNKDQLESFAIGMNLSLFGIGAELQSVDGFCVIRRLLPNGPADKSKKIKVDDRIVAVAQADGPFVDVIEMNLNKAVALIRGPKGTEVRLAISPADDRSARNVVTLVRDEIKLVDQEAKAKIIDMPSARGGTARVGVIDLPSFYASFDPAHTRTNSEPKSTTSDVVKLLRKLKEEKVAGVVLDLRRNGGGSLEEAIRLTGLFIKKGPVVQIRDMDGSIEQNADIDPSVAYGGPLMVLTSRFSASASEILAGALQDYGRALIVGDASTHGKGTVQTVQHLAPYMRAGGINLTNDPGAVKLTIKKFYRASGASTQLKGVTPDITLPSVFNESKDIGESAFENPMPWDTIPAADFERLDMVSPFVSELQKLSDARIATNKDFEYICEDIAIFKKLQEDKTVSLNEQEQLAKKNEAKLRQKARDKERLARPEPDEKVYEITLKLADVPGLPPPVARTNNVATAGQDTSSAVAAMAKALSETDPDTDAEDSEENKPPAIDATLDEARHILVDYVSLLRRNEIARGTTSVKKKPRSPGRL